MNTSCPKCDRPLAECKNWRDCVSNAVDWRQRALKAEAALALAATAPTPSDIQSPPR